MQGIAMNVMPSGVPGLVRTPSGSPNSDDDVSRILFDPPEGRRLSRIRKSLWGLHQPSDEDESETDQASDTSIASTMVADRGIRSVENVQKLLSLNSTIAERARVVSDADGIEAEAHSEVAIEPSCHAGVNLSPKELAGVFAMFERKESTAWPPSGENASSEIALSEVSETASTAVTSNTGPAGESWARKVDSLEREIATLKDSIEKDAAELAKLRSEGAVYRATFITKSNEISRLKVEHAVVLHKAEALAELETQHQETIQLLKDQVDKLSKTPIESATQKKELDQLRLENALFASQIIENEVEMHSALQAVERLQSENLDMKTQIDSLCGIIESKEANEKLCVPPLADQLVTEQLETLTNRLVVIERERESMKIAVENERLERKVELDELKDMISLEHALSSSRDLEDSLSLVTDPDCDQSVELQVGSTVKDVKVLLEGTIEDCDSKEGKNDEQAGKRKETEPEHVTGGLCDCFPSLAINSDE